MFDWNLIKFEFYVWYEIIVATNRKYLVGQKL